MLQSHFHRDSLSEHPDELKENITEFRSVLLVAQLVCVCWWRAVKCANDAIRRDDVGKSRRRSNIAIAAYIFCIVVKSASMVKFVKLFRVLTLLQKYLHVYIVTLLVRLEGRLSVTLLVRRHDR